MKIATKKTIQLNDFEKDMLLSTINLLHELADEVSDEADWLCGIATSLEEVRYTDEFTVMEESEEV